MPPDATVSATAEPRVNRALAGRQAGNPRKQWAGRQDLWKSPFYAGFRAGVSAIVVVGLWRFLTADSGDAGEGVSGAPSAASPAGVQNQVAAGSKGEGVSEG